MLLQVLGTAAGGGLPQWNCACPGCTGARAHPERRRRHAALAVHAGGGDWYLVNATPDIGDQIEATPALHPGAGPDMRRTPVAGVVLTDAELDHTLGLARLREARDGVEVLATAPVRDAVREGLRLDTVLEPYTRVRWRELPLGRGAPLTDGSGIHAAAVPVSAKRPRYAVGVGHGAGVVAGVGHGARAVAGVGRYADAAPAPAHAPAPDPDTWSIALHLTEPATGRTLLYAPSLAVWSDAFDEAARVADCVIVDGTFWDDDEPVRAGFSTRTATGMGHRPIAGPTGTAHRLAHLPGRVLYTHLNNTNPLNDPHAEQHKLLAEWGIEVAADGMVIEL
ncbi:MBL fold metallo-hydrolase [Streptomyces sp. NPDC004732]|uniref:pyrroloquinoline quinone biosynthesis protein PqqB n=1 Tax=Streptomyces sp. NPDC004732 TaxID=3154290 RepID=UPI0033B3AA0E